MRGVVHPRSKQHCPPDSGLAASCCHFYFFYICSLLARARPRVPFVERRTRSCQSIRAEINQKGTIGRTWASLSLPPRVSRPCADARFSSIKILNSATPLWQFRFETRNNEGDEEGRRRGEREEVETKERMATCHGNIMPQRPRAQHLSGVAAENDHWLRRGGLRSQFPSPSAQSAIFICIWDLSRARISAEERENWIATDEKTGSYSACYLPPRLSKCVVIDSSSSAIVAQSLSILILALIDVLLLTF